MPAVVGLPQEGPPSREDLRHRQLRLDVKDGGCSSTAVAHLASTAALPRATVVVTTVARLASLHRRTTSGLRGGDRRVSVVVTSE
jgi:hypothetical protein